MENKNQELLDDFRDFCLQHAELRFWQALRAWADVGFILTAKSRDLVSNEYEELMDTFYFTSKDGFISEHI
jgi:hypothetical protein